MNKYFLLGIFAFSILFSSCKNEKDNAAESEETNKDKMVAEGIDIENRVNQYAEVKLTSDLNNLSENQKKIIPLLIEAAKITDELFWYQAFGGRDTLMPKLGEMSAEYVNLNYGPWDRLNNMQPFIEGYGPKPEAANFYPSDMTKEEFNNADLSNKESLYTFIRRNDQGDLTAVWYHEMFPEKLNKASDLLKQAAELAEDPGFKKYLNLRAEAFLTDEYYESDVAWMQMKDNSIDMVTGPIETYEDRLFGSKAAFESYVLIKDKEWSERLAKYVAFLPMLQRELPVEAKYKKDSPGTESDLNAYDVVYYAGDSNAGSKTIAINLPNDEKVQQEYGSRRLQLKNAMRAKYDQILVPISEELIAEEQRKHITFDAFFANTMFHEVAHGLGIKNTINQKGTVREALKEYSSALEEGKADVLGIYMITKLHDKGEIKDAELMDYYVTFLSSIFRSVRFGASSAHGKANMVRFNYFKEMGAFTQDETGMYSVDMPKFREAIDALSNDILVLQGEGDYEGAGRLLNEKGQIDSELEASLTQLSEKNIPVDIKFEQGTKVLGL
ncbi:Zn-dependent hydrolase [Gramella sp. KN1008]|uniref:dipeptidyl-peptidase 3 family protein n=1 Tax=Gramella sp. KN1008 TaxID=2529298 RepID=UPI00103C2E88|nr:Zn-dependent hydrolase [Gramella sp. KN1008]TBW26404.1 Zn-dependent hydrolase [Gramella sp. KN1008]